MDKVDLECLKSNIDQVVRIETSKGEHVLINVISVFDEESDPDVFFHDVTDDPERKNFDQTKGNSLPISQIVSVRKYQDGGRA